MNRNIKVWPQNQPEFHVMVKMEWQKAKHFRLSLDFSLSFDDIIGALAPVACGPRGLITPSQSMLELV
jgi:hypothetical protein